MCENYNKLLNQQTTARKKPRKSIIKQAIQSLVWVVHSNLKNQTVTPIKFSVGFRGLQNETSPKFSVFFQLALIAAYKKQVHNSRKIMPLGSM
jgi:hypothetical protein